MNFKTLIRDAVAASRNPRPWLRLRVLDPSDLPLPDGFILTVTTAGTWLLDLPDRDGIGGGCIEGADEVSLRHAAWAIEDLADEGLLEAAVREIAATLDGGDPE